HGVRAARLSGRVRAAVHGVDVLDAHVVAAGKDDAAALRHVTYLGRRAVVAGGSASGGPAGRGSAAGRPTGAGSAVAGRGAGQTEELGDVIRGAGPGVIEILRRGAAAVLGVDRDPVVHAGDRDGLHHDPAAAVAKARARVAIQHVGRGRRLREALDVGPLLE